MPDGDEVDGGEFFVGEVAEFSAGADFGGFFEEMVFAILHAFEADGGHFFGEEGFPFGEAEFVEVGVGGDFLEVCGAEVGPEGDAVAVAGEDAGVVDAVVAGVEVEGDADGAAGAEDAFDFVEDLGGFGEVFEDAGGEDEVEGGVGEVHAGGIHLADVEARGPLDVELSEEFGGELGVEAEEFAGDGFAGADDAIFAEHGEVGAGSEAGGDDVEVDADDVVFSGEVEHLAEFLTGADFEDALFFDGHAGVLADEFLELAEAGDGDADLFGDVFGVLAVEVEAFAHAGHETDLGGGVGFESGGHEGPLGVVAAVRKKPRGDTGDGGGRMFGRGKGGLLRLGHGSVYR